MFEEYRDSLWASTPVQENFPVASGDDSPVYFECSVMTLLFPYLGESPRGVPFCREYRWGLTYYRDSRWASTNIENCCNPYHT